MRLPINLMNTALNENFKMVYRQLRDFSRRLWPVEGHANRGCANRGMSQLRTSTYWIFWILLFLSHFLTICNAMKNFVRKDRIIFFSDSTNHRFHIFKRRFLSSLWKSYSHYMIVFIFICLNYTFGARKRVKISYLEGQIGQLGHPLTGIGYAA